MPLEKGQRVLPTVPGPDDASDGAPGHAMTSKQARKSYLERTRGPKMTKDEQRVEERRLQAEIRRDIKRRDQEEKKAQERERAQARAKAQRERAKAKDEADKAAKRKAGKPLKPPRPSQATILGFMRGNGAKKRAPDQEADDGLPVIAEASVSPASSVASSAKRRRLSETKATEVVCPPFRKPEAASPADSSELANPEGHAAEETAMTANGDDNLPCERSASPEAAPVQEQEPSRMPFRRESSEPDIRTASPTPVSSPRAEEKEQPMAVAISFSLDDFEDSLISSTQLDEEIQDPGNTPVSDAVEENKASIGGKRGTHIPGDTGPRPLAENISCLLPFLSTQDCSLSEADITEIETPINPSHRPLRSDRAAPVIHVDAAPAFKAPTRPKQAAEPARPPLVPISNTRLAPQASPWARRQGADTRCVPPFKTASAAKLTDEDLFALQSEDWDDDISLGKGPSPRTARAATAQADGNAKAPPPLRLSSSDILTLASVDWDDDL